MFGHLAVLDIVVTLEVPLLPATEGTAVFFNVGRQWVQTNAAVVQCHGCVAGCVWLVHWLYCGVAGGTLHVVVLVWVNILLAPLFSLV